ncbi:MAG: glucoamylase family protein [Pseudomonadota bacterium]|nr:glucoamylase family protein [Pseudomonadota bacterium]
MLFEDAIRGEAFSVERLEQYATYLARELTVAKVPNTGQSLLPRVKENSEVLVKAYRQLTQAVADKRTIPPAGEWLIDNFHIIEDQIREVRHDLPKEYYFELPKLTIGDLAGRPRVYAIALTLVAHLDSRLETNTIRRFIQSYQKISPLMMGELWAIAITLRVALLENLRRVIVRMAYVQEVKQAADDFAENLLAAVDKTELDLSERIEEVPNLLGKSRLCDCAVAVQLAKRLRDQSPELLPAYNYLAECLKNHNLTVEQATLQDHQQQAVDQVTVGNIVNSMRLLSSIDWKEFFESVSLVDEILANDPTGTYKRMDFSSRDRYRHTIERICRKSKFDEMTIAGAAIQLAQKSKQDAIDISQHHVGYYLIDRGLNHLESSVGLKPSISTAAKRALLNHPTSFYLSTLLMTSFIIFAPLLYYIYSQGASWFKVFIFLFVGGALVSDTALNLLNLFVTALIGPRVLPKIDLDKEIPDEARTFVIIPSLFSGMDSVSKLLETIEVHYLSNQSRNLFFALLSDFTDADHEKMGNDEELIALAEKGISALNGQYCQTGQPQFFLFHRYRKWNPQENKWMGWERKRGKIHEFNRFLRGNKNTSFKVAPSHSNLFSEIRYVITLDSDTQLPRGAAKRLIGTILHPLNSPQFDVKSRRVAKGYGVLQPRISIAPKSSESSFFARIFSGHTGIDPYTTAVSDVYQDLFGEGTYTGKGLYVVDTFEDALAGKAPENAILSHDLFEGIFARTALVSDIEFLDEYPSHYEAFAKRQHRWARGDWQIFRWLFHPDLAVISRWKIFDNLRRSFVAPSTLLLLILAWTILPGSSLVGTLAIVALLALPSYAHATNSLLFHSRGIPWMSHLRNVWGDLGTSSVQILLFLLVLPHQAWLQVDAIVRTLYRLFISKRRLLQWLSAAEAESGMLSKKKLSFDIIWVPRIVALGLLTFLALTPSLVFFIAGPFLGIWLLSPTIISKISRKRAPQVSALSQEDRRELRRIARRTWHFFETFIGEKDHWLPPDNFQEDPDLVIAHRTSPTNLGLLLLSTTAAHDLGFIGSLELVERLELTLSSMESLERRHGHFFNWYDTNSLQALNPIYISTVDSGNLAGHLMAVKQACLSLPDKPLISSVVSTGLVDTILEMKAKLSAIDSRHLVTSSITRDQLAIEIERCLASALSKTPESLDAWEIYISEVRAHLNAILGLINTLSLEHASDIFAGLLNWTNTSLRMVAKLEAQAQAFQLEDFFDDFVIRSRRLAQRCHDLAMDMDFSILFDNERKIFCVGYNVEQNSRDNSYYDLLASEARLASFMAIAKGDVPQSHWFHLGRQMTVLYGKRTLISWSASMFEYLMPLLVMKNFANTLLYETHESVVGQQVKYAKKMGIPWGISESAYNGRDLQMNYQYGPFGVPGLGLKRGLSDNLVVSPYSTALAAMVSPTSAVKNFRKLVEAGLLTDYGFYESVDYTKERLLPHQVQRIIQSFMAHHQGMTLVSLNNALNENITQTRFHSDPAIRSAELLLQERNPLRVSITHPRAEEAHAEALSVRAIQPADVRRFSSPHSLYPKTQILSNGNYTVMLTAGGSGYSRCGELAVTRWAEDSTRDALGNFIFIKDIKSGLFWSAGHQPSGISPQSFEAIFAEHKVEFHRRDGNILTHMEVVVSPEDNVELRMITLTNISANEREMEITSYLEPVLASTEADLAHPAFSNLFLQTEYISPRTALLARRRPRSGSDPECWGFHVAASEGDNFKFAEYETNRAKFIGRGRTLMNPIIMTGNIPLSGEVGTPLDPIFSLRRRVIIPPYGVIKICFSTGVVDSREEALRLIDQYHNINSFNRENELAWTQTQVQLRHLGMPADEAKIYQKLAGALLYSNRDARLPSDTLMLCELPQSALWRHGISGDLPILLVQITGERDISLARELLRGHEYLRLKKLSVDLVFLNVEKTGYFLPLQEELDRQVLASGNHGLLNKSGGIFLLRSDTLSNQDKFLLQAAARVFLDGYRGTLKEQMTRLQPGKDRAQVYPPDQPSEVSYPPARLVRPELKFFNGLGGFTADSKEYVIFLEKDRTTPAPWINVIANSKDFGFLISETGSGYTWSGNSRENRLTPWSNDAVIDPSGEIIYLRDEDSGHIWSPTPWPIPTTGPTIVRHGQGYTQFEHSSHGIHHHLLMYVPVDEEIKICRLRLKNLDAKKKRRISLTYFVEWVLGTNRAKTAHHVVTQPGPLPGVVLARNPFSIDFGTRVAFAGVSGGVESFTCDRREFIGRNGSYAKPRGFERDNFSGKIGAGLDPCAAINRSIVLGPNEEQEIIFVLGQVSSLDLVEPLVGRYLKNSEAESALVQVKNFWDGFLGAMQFKTPSEESNILLNRWLLYQTLGCRIWARSAFYQSGGAFGFRDQLQDVMALTFSKPEVTRGQILRAACHQFIEGDVQHWWHPPSNRGVRTHFSDDLLWLPYVTADYIRTTGDGAILDEELPFLSAPLIPPDREDLYVQPSKTHETASLFEHCCRAIDKSLKVGAHGLPLMGTGDWNDGMNRVGHGGKGESVWLAWFLIKVLNEFAPLCETRGEMVRRDKYKRHAESLALALESTGWDGKWYRRAYFDDGTPLGSEQSQECQIDSIAQSWAVLSGAALPERASQAMQSVNERLIRRQNRIIPLFWPPFDKTDLDPGYIKGYVPGIRENGAQYTHAAIWAGMAFAKLTDGDRAMEVLSMLNPISHSDSIESVNTYKVEPYVIAADVYTLPPHTGRGGWSWYTGSAGWFYQALVQSVLGLHNTGKVLRWKPCLPNAWPGYEVTIRSGQSSYHVHVKNSQELKLGEIKIERDGQYLESAELVLDDDNKNHEILVLIGARPLVV